MSDPSESESHLQQLIGEKHKAVVLCLDALHAAYSEATRANVVNAVQGLEKALHQLQQVLAVAYQPKWLNDLQVACTQYLANKNAARVMMDFYTVVQDSTPLARGMRWYFDEPQADLLLDFDALIGKYVEESRTEELLDKLITTLEDILQSGEVDSRSATEALQAMLATLKNAKGKPYFNQLYTFRFVREYSQHLMLEFLKYVPGLAPFVTAWEKTASDLGEEYETVGSKAREELKSIASKRSDSLRETLTQQVELLAKLERKAAGEASNGDDSGANEKGGDA